MMLSDAIAQYVAHKQSMGMRFCTEARTLKSFRRAMGDIEMREVTPCCVLAFLAGAGPVTRSWERKHQALSGFYSYAIGRGYATHSPLPRSIPKPSEAFVPYIYSREELRRLLDATVAIDNPRSSIDPDTLRTLLLALYGAGLRISEALALTVADVDLTAGVLHIRDSKFYKTRLVPLGADLVQLLARYVAKWHRDCPDPQRPFFVSRYGTAVKVKAAENAFYRLRIRAGVVRYGAPSRHQPRLHDLRHALTLHRILSWYRSGADVQRLLPQLSTYLGHVNIAATQRYLALTPELLREASTRFECYVMETSHA